MEITKDRIIMRRPFDAHLHVRDGVFMESVIGHSAHAFGGGIIMPNLKSPIVTVAQAEEYRERILLASMTSGFKPMMTLYLTEATTPDEITKANEVGFIIGVKCYPAGATTNSGSGVQDLCSVYPVLERMEKLGIPLLLHGEYIGHGVEVLDREARFIETIGLQLINDFPYLKIVFEHITTIEAVAMVMESRPGVAATSLRSTVS